MAKARLVSFLTPFNFKKGSISDFLKLVCSITDIKIKVTLTNKSFLSVIITNTSKCGVLRRCW